MSDQPAQTKQRMLTFASGGWVLLLTGIITAALFFWALWPALTSSLQRLGDGENIESYGFDLSTCVVDRDLIVPGMKYRDLVTPLNEPAMMRGDDVDAYNKEIRGKFLVSTDRVAGVVVNDEARAYPMQMLNVHEVINDVAGGVPIVITYSPWCDSFAAFERTVNGEVLEFCISGLLYNSNLLMYDKRLLPEDASQHSGLSPSEYQARAGESLWGQLESRALAGPAAQRGDSLTPLHVSVLPWSEWLHLHPDTLVIDPRSLTSKRYEKTNYERYFLVDELEYTVRPMPNESSIDLKERVLAVSTHSGEERVYPFSLIADHADDEGRWFDSIGDVDVQFTVYEAPRTVIAAAVNAQDVISTMQSFWFAWHAAHPESDLAH